MFLRHIASLVLFLSLVPSLILAQSTEKDPSSLFLELNEVQDAGTACRLTFLVRNETGQTIDQSIFETVVFDSSGSVVSLSLFDFRDLPADRPRVRQFELPNMACGTVGKVLINGANSCLIEGVESEICDKYLSLSSRQAVELLG
ncbi:MULTISPECIES: hypothetical protein [unclassified Pseudophaeobacter]|uniref:hypothetical protein n=1 Tax=unclassified Pseudophaeobacter TaxID=2637024 RepID=UPI000EFC1409|nr:hypothetical protein [Pseudophaeobacter sp. EL27]